MAKLDKNLPKNTNLNTQKVNGLNIDKQTDKALMEAKARLKESLKKEDATPSENPKNLRTRLKSDSIDIQDLDALNEQNIKQFRIRSRRNRGIIITLSVLLVIVVAVVAIYFALTKLSNNCYLYVEGANAVYLVDGKELENFRTPADIQGYRIYKFDLKLKVKSSGKYNVKCEIKVYQANKLLENILIYEPNNEIFQRETATSYVSSSPIDGNQTIQLCQGIIIDGQYEETLNADNFKMEIFTYFERVEQY